VLLVCDIGNSNIVLGLYDGDGLEAHWRLTSRHDATVDEYVVLVGGLLDRFGAERSVAAAIVSSVVPPLTQKIDEAVQALFGIRPLIVGPGLRTGLDIQYDDPREVGADRIVNAVGALNRHAPPLIAVDFGTATTFDVVLPPNIYLGGVIVPGVIVARDALIERTALLPNIEVRAVDRVVGRNTAESIRSGLYRGTGVMVDGMIDAIAEEQAIDPVVIATGGLAPLIASAASRIDHVEMDLTLWGLRQLWLKNK